MPDLLTSAEKISITGDLFSLFLTQSRGVLINKEPIATIIDNNSNSNFYGYDNTSQQTNYTFTPVSGTYSAVVRYGKEQGLENFQEVKTYIPKGKCRIKVMESGKNFILDGRKTESVVVDGNIFNLVSNDGIKEHFGLKFYYFMLERTN